MKEGKSHFALVAASLLFAVMLSGLLLPGWKRRWRPTYANYLTPATAEAAEVNPWIQAVEKVKEDRGEPTGKQAKVDIPQQVRHYSDTRRFLAVQTAEWRKHAFQSPQDFVELAAMIRSGQLVELKTVTENYILFGVGGNATEGPFTRYENGHSISLYSEAELQQEYARSADSRLKVKQKIAAVKQELSAVKRRDRSKRVKLQAQIAEMEKSFEAERDDKELLDRYYGNAERRRQLLRDYESIEGLAKGLPDRTYDISDGRARQQLKVRMLSSLRPEALKLLDEVAVSYRQKFQRPLPITSLVRPDEYQRSLSKVNPNVTLIETPPHSTGLAFDIYYRFMTTEEQSHIMAHLARLKDEGRIEVLRENRDHYHVFAFVDGVKPDEALIRDSLGGASGTKVREKVSKKRVITKKNKRARVKRR